MRQTHPRRTATPYAPLCILLLCAAAFFPTPLMAGPKPTSCPLMITTCGCVITHPDTYIAVADLNATQSGQNCIEIAASKSILNLNGFKVFGMNDGTGIGVLIRRNTDHVIVEGGNESSNDPAQNPSEDAPVTSATARQSEVSRWNIGIEDDGNEAVIALFSAVGGVGLLPHGHTPGNTVGGVLLNGVTRSFVGDLNADFNGQYGVLLQNSTGNTVANISADNNVETGLKLVSSNSTSIGPGAAVGNGKYGIWMQSSSSNRIHDSNGNMMNGDTGILLGCASGPACPANDGSNRNAITNAGAPNNQVAGIQLGLGCLNNIVTVTHNEGNQAQNSDMIDLNPNCGSNVWYNNVGHGNQTCTEN